MGRNRKPVATPAVLFISVALPLLIFPPPLQALHLLLITALSLFWYLFPRKTKLKGLPKTKESTLKH
jgi:hypothetical protein